MAQDVFVLTTDKEKFQFFKKNYPAAKQLSFDELSEDAIKKAAKSGFTRFFYVVRTVDKKFDTSFDFNFSPSPDDDMYVHVWNNVDELLLFNRKDVKKDPQKFTDKEIKKGNVNFKFHKHSVLVGDKIFQFEEPDIFILCQTQRGGELFVANNLSSFKRNIQYIVAEKGLDENALNKAITNTRTDLFYIVDSRTIIKNTFNFGDSQASYWDAQYVHVWNLCKGVRLFHKATVEADITSFTDEAWLSGKTPLKNHEEDYFEFDEKAFDYIEQAKNECDIFVIGKDKKWFNEFRTKPGHSRCHFIAADVITQDVIEKTINMTRTDFFYIIHEKTNIRNDFSFEFIPKDRWDLNYIHMWENNPDVILLHKELIKQIPDIFDESGINYKKKACKSHDEKIFSDKQEWPLYTDLDKARNECTTRFFFYQEDDVKLVEDFDKTYRPAPWDTNKIHVWQRINPWTEKVYDYGGISLYPNIDEPKGKQYVRRPGAISKPYDVVFLSYREEFADENFAKLQERVPWAKRVHGVKGIYEAHKKAAEIANTPMFYVVDADAELYEGFNFSFMPRKEDEHKVYVWRSKNPINGLIYGYGGVKLFPRDTLLQSSEYRVDFTTSISKNFVPVSQISNLTKFNTDPFNTWKSAFRECAKLASQTIDKQSKETKARLDTWCTDGADMKFGEYAISGALAGKEFGENNKGNQQEMRKINDYDWLEQEFKKGYDYDD